jgi:hypothetical protein
MPKTEPNKTNVFVRVKLDDLSIKTARLLTGNELNKKAEKDLQVFQRTHLVCFKNNNELKNE